MQPLHYHLSPASLNAHRFALTLHIARPAADQLVSLPVWIPGSYLVRDFARHLLGLQAQQRGLACTVTPVDKCTWKIACSADQPLTLRYQIYAHDASVRCAWLDAQRGFFNGTSVFLRVHGQEALPHTVSLDAADWPAGWSLAWALPRLDPRSATASPTATRTDRRTRPGARAANAPDTGLAQQPASPEPSGWGTYTAPDYDALVDAPAELGPFWQGQFDAAGVPHRVVVAGATPGWDSARLLADMQAICTAEIAFWHGDTPDAAPHRDYLFLIWAVHDGYGGLEHRNSTALICRRSDLPQPGMTTPTEGYTTLLGLVSHEYFHTWSVKRLRPAAFARYDYTRENHTTLLWFFEGLTSYYDDLLLVRSGRITPQAYLGLLTKTLQQVLATPGRKVQSLAQASWDAWTKFYRPDEATPNLTLSYYSGGALVGLCLDAALRQAGRSLDDLMRALWQRCAAGPLTEADVHAQLRDWHLGGLADALRTWVHTPGEPPWQQAVDTLGLRYEFESASRAQQLGLRLKEAPNSVTVTHVLADTPAEAAGLAPGDECLAVTVGRGANQRTWRLHTATDLDGALGHARTARLLVARDRLVLSLRLRLPARPSRQPVLKVGHTQRLDAWLGATAGRITPHVSTQTQT